MDRASGFYPEGWGFESLRLYLKDILMGYLERFFNSIYLFFVYQKEFRERPSNTKTKQWLKEYHEFVMTELDNFKAVASVVKDGCIFRATIKSFNCEFILTKNVANGNWYLTTWNLRSNILLYHHDILDVPPVGAISYIRKKFDIDEKISLVQYGIDELEKTNARKARNEIEKYSKEILTSSVQQSNEQ